MFCWKSALAKLAVTLREENDHNFFRNDCDFVLCHYNNVL